MRDSPRPTWDVTWMAVAGVISKRSLCIRAQVGCLIVDASNRPVASGYNGPPAGFPRREDVTDAIGCRSFCARAAGTEALSPSYEDCRAVHAEVNALLFADRRDYAGGTLYVTSPICSQCSKIVANCGVSRVVYMPDGDRAYRAPSVGVDLLRECGLVVDEWAFSTA